jgi:hypothetical protein
MAIHNSEGTEQAGGRLSRHHQRVGTSGAGRSATPVGDTTLGVGPRLREGKNLGD